MDKYELFAVQHFLRSYPEELSFTDLMQALRNDGSEIWAWELVEAVPLEYLAGLIEDMVSSLRVCFK